MSLHALDDIGDAIDATQSFLFPVDAQQWLRLAVVVFFIGGGGGGLNGLRGLNGASDLPSSEGGGLNGLRGLNGASDLPSSEGGGGGSVGPAGEFSLMAPFDGLVTRLLVQVPGPGIPSEPPEELLAGVGGVVILAVIAIGVFALVVGLLSNFMEFVFTQALIEREIHLRQYFAENTGNGIRLFVFRLAIDFLSLLALALVGIVAFVLVFGGETTNVGPEAFLPLIPFAAGTFAIGAVVFGTLTGFTNVFVVPLVIQGNDGIIGSWRRLLASITEQPKQYLAYLFLSLVLGIGVGIVGAIVGVIAVIVLAIPFGIMGAGIVIGLGQHGVGLALAGIVGVTFVVCVALLTTLIKVPLQSFLRYYAMLVLGDIDEALDPIPDVRADIRATGE